MGRRQAFKSILPKINPKKFKQNSKNLGERQDIMRGIYCLVVIIFCFSAGCQARTNQDKEKLKNTVTQKTDAQPKKVAEASGNKKVDSVQEKNTSPKLTSSAFYVFDDKASRNNHYNPSGFMPNGHCVKFNDQLTEKCQSGKTCIKIDYDVACSREDQKWAGVYWLNPPNNWGKQKGGFNLTGMQKLTFWAKGEKGGEQIQEFTVGGIAGDYPDTDKAVIGPVILTSEWKEYTIDLRGKDLSYISGGFAWVTSEDVNAEGCTFYLDNIKFE